MNLFPRSPLVAGLLLATAAVSSGVANASANDHQGGPTKSAAKSQATSCKKRGKSYKVHGVFSGGDLTRVAGGTTERRNDDRYSGTIVVEITGGNRRGQRDLGLRSYAVSGVRILGIPSDGELPDEGASVDLVGKLKAPCAAARRSQDEEPATEDAEVEVTNPDAASEDEAAEGHGRSGDSDDDSAPSSGEQQPILDAVTDVNLRVVRFQPG